MHGLPTWEHRDPADFRAAVREDILSHYDTVTFQDAVITDVTKLEREDGSTLFRAVDKENREYWGRKLVIATGIRDIMPDIEGYKECWGNSM